MAVDLSDLIENLKREVSSPGTEETSFPGATDENWLGNLQDGFWESVLDGVISGYTESDGIVSPSSGTTDLSRDLQQLVVFYAGFKIVRNQLRSLSTLFRAKSGDNEYEKQQAATWLKALLDELTRKRNILLDRLSDIGSVDSTYIDAIVRRTQSVSDGDTYWTDY